MFPNEHMAYDVNTVIESYADYLRSIKQSLWERFQRMRRDEPESAKAEAVVFRVLQYCNAGPEVADMPNSGGPDFLCFKNNLARFIVEATSFLPQKVTSNTGIPNEVPDGIWGGAIGLMTTPIAQKVDEKSYQFENLTMPGIMAIASSHFGASMVLDELAAQYALMGQLYWTFNDDQPATNFTSSLFLQLDDNGAIAGKNTKISALILVSITEDRSYVCGALHPDAVYPLKSELLWMINFVYSKDWPIENNKVRLAWTMGSRYKSYEVPHAPIRFSKTK